MDGGSRGVRGSGGRLEARGDLSLALTPLYQGLVSGLNLFRDLRKTARKHLVLRLGARDLVAQLRVGERLGVGLTLRRALVCGELRLLGAQGAPELGGTLCFGNQLVEAVLQLAGAHLGVRVLGAHALVLGRGLGALLLAGREGHAHLGETRHHVLPLLLQQAHV